ncbi:hypothetical protein [Streptomyces sp. GQFP]|uniref:hypothetical protein n=1 Tax=Streptomyces sp. GQFP TaxID=2907545 RepID=UPI001F42684C|nr:hypothetical protein [Streptomyces sp. GQFP]UIX33436.1 hypothetical protein LUX31_27420 [Streptomyces sp. GQFP]
MSEITGHRSTATAVVHESYSFACMRCGHGWEQSYEIEHHVDGNGADMVMYVADGRVVPSPLTRPTCQNCDNHVVRIMRAGQVSAVQRSVQRQRQRSAPEAAPAADGAVGAVGAVEVPKEPHHWHFSDLLHPFHRKAS